MRCPKCGAHMEMDRSQVYTSIPPQYKFRCPNCGNQEFGTADRDYDDSIDESEHANDKGTCYIVTMESLRDLFQNAMDIAKLHSEQSIGNNKESYEQALRIFKCLRDAAVDYITKDEKLTNEQLSISAHNVHDADNVIAVLSADNTSTQACINE